MKNNTMTIDVKLLYKIVKTMKEYMAEMRVNNKNIVKIHDIKMKYNCFDELLSGSSNITEYLSKTLDKYERLLHSEKLTNGIIAVEEQENDTNTS